MTLFGPDFYPTPPEVAATMLDPLDLRGLVVLEPSAGSGNLVRECLARGAAEVLCCEPEPELRAILAAALETMRREGITGDDLLACIDRLKRSAAPGRAG